MIKVGITGGIGSGKTTVCKEFEKLGISVYYTDLEAKHLFETDNDIKIDVYNNFGPDVFIDNKPYTIIDRKKIAQIVFNDEEKLEKLNSIIHPKLWADFEKWCELHKNEKYVIMEAAILFESGADSKVDKIIVVTAPIETRIERVIKRDNITREEVLSRMNNQIDEEWKEEHSDFLIDTSTNMNDIDECVIFINNMFL